MSIAANNKISIIVPIYNAEKFLNVLFESVTKQTSPLWEMICIDDGSSDSSGNIVDKWTSENNSIHVIHQTNQGVSAARNRGIEEASTPYVTFVDADDYIEPDFVEKAIEALKKTECDIVICGYAKHYDDNREEKVLPRYQGQLSLSYDVLKETPPFPWAKVFRRDVLLQQHIRFIEGMPVGEDTLFCYDYLIHARTVFFLKDVVYHYKEGSGAWNKFALGQAPSMHYEQMLDIVVKTLKKLPSLPSKQRKIWWYELHRQTLRLTMLLHDGCKISASLQRKLQWKGLKLLLFIDLHLPPYKLAITLKTYIKRFLLS